MSEKAVGVVGVGLMGHGIAANVQKHGWPLAFLRHAGNQPTDDLEAAGATPVATGAELAAASDVVILCVNGSAQVADVLTRDDGVIAGLRPGATVIDCSTAIPAETMRMAQAVAAVGARFLDAPMTRTAIEAAQGRLGLIVGGPRELFEEHLPLLETFGESIVHAGPVGAGHKLKLLHNYVSLGFCALLMEAMNASRGAEIDPKVFHDILANGGGRSAALERIGPAFLGDGPDAMKFSIGNAFKDLDYFTAMLDSLAVDGEIAYAVRDLVRKGVEAGHADRYLPQLLEDLMPKADS